jgi:hypothetical protein
MKYQCLEDFTSSLTNRKFKKNQIIKQYIYDADLTDSEKLKYFEKI